MKNKGFKIASIIVASILSILVLIGTIVPAIKYENIDLTEANVYFFSLFGEASIGGASVYTATSFGAIFASIVFVAAPLCVIFDNKIVKASGLIADGVMLSFAIYVLKLADQVEDNLSAMSGGKVTHAGATLILVAAILAILYAAIDLVILVFGDKLKSVVIKGSKTTKELLEENEELCKSGYISVEERDARKAKILGVK